MANPPMANNKATLLTLTSLLLACFSQAALAQSLPVTAAQKQTASGVAQQGVPVGDLADSAPDRYTVKSGDTLWSISLLFLKSPWRWPEIWGMNMSDISNPHRIYPGQVIDLVRNNGMATLRMGGSKLSGSASTPTDTIRVTPRTRYEGLSDLALPTLRTNVIEPFLAEPIVVDEQTLNEAPRIVATQDGRVLLTRGDRAYARGSDGNPLLDDAAKEKQFRVFRNATPLKDPGTGQVLGYEAQYVGKAVLVRGESSTELPSEDKEPKTAIVPATIDIVSAKEEMRVGDRLLPEPTRQWLTYIPHAPAVKVQGRIVSVYGGAVVNAAQNQVVAINLGTNHGIEVGHVIAIQKDGATLIDKSDKERRLMKLPDERNGLMMVFRTFDAISYALVLDITDGVRVGDRLTNPR